MHPPKPVPKSDVGHRFPAVDMAMSMLTQQMYVCHARMNAR